MAKNEGTQHVANDNEVDILKPEGDDLVVDVVDDTPPEDRGRKPLEHDPLAKEDDDEAAKYTKGVQKRIGELTHKAHDERRARERAEREREEALRFAQAAHQRARMLEQQLTSGEAAFANTTTEKEELAVLTAQSEYKKAYEAGDPDAIATATAKIAAAAQRLEQAKAWSLQAKHKVENSALQKDDHGVDSTARDVANTQPNVEEPEPAAMEWSKKNPWFGKDRKMTSYVYGIHEELVFEKGLHPIENADDYYAAIDEEMRKRFPDYGWEGNDDTAQAPAAKSQPAAKAKATSVVAPVSRTPAGTGNKVTLTASEKAIAEKFGLTLEQYAREKLKLSQGGV